MTYRAVFLFSFICILTMDVYNQISRLIGLPGWGTSFLLCLNVLSVAGLLLMNRRLQWQSKLPKRGLLAIKLFWLWALITFMHGIANSHDYWDWKILFTVYLPSVLISLALILGVDFEYSKKVLRFILVVLFPASFISIPFTLTFTDEFFARLVMPVCVFVLISPYLKKKWRLLVIVVAIISIALDVSYRANVIRILIPLALFFLFYFRNFWKPKLINFVLVGAFLLPLVLLTLGISGMFNPFSEKKIDYEVTTVLHGEEGASNIMEDTRTFLYREVFHSMQNRGSSFLVGEGATAGYETDHFLDAVLNEKGRYRSEVGFLNSLLYSGAIGVVFYALVLFLPAYYAINQSNNRLCKMLGIFLASRWLMFFVEDIAQYDMNFFFLWLTIGFCLSNKFRSLTDAEVVEFFKLKTTPAQSWLVRR